MITQNNHTQQNPPCGRVLFPSFIYIQRKIYRCYFTASFNALPAVNFGTVIAGIWIFAFV
jgi:hypothetical protein